MSGRAHKGRAQGDQVGELQDLKTLIQTAALRVDRALADTSPASARLLGKSNQVSAYDALAASSLKTVFKRPANDQYTPEQTKAAKPIG